MLCPGFTTLQLMKPNLKPSSASWACSDGGSRNQSCRCLRTHQFLRVLQWGHSLKVVCHTGFSFWLVNSSGGPIWGRLSGTLLRHAQPALVVSPISCGDYFGHCLYRLVPGLTSHCGRPIVQTGSCFGSVRASLVFRDCATAHPSCVLTPRSPDGHCFWQWTPVRVQIVEEMFSSPRSHCKPDIGVSPPN